MNADDRADEIARNHKHRPTPGNCHVCYLVGRLTRPPEPDLLTQFWDSIYDIRAERAAHHPWQADDPTFDPYGDT